MQRFKWPEPAWIAELPEEDRPVARLRFHINLAACYFSERATCTALSEKMGVGYTALNMARQRGSVSPKLAKKIEAELGAELFPAGLFNDLFNDLFADAE